MLLALVLPNFAFAAPEALEPIVLRKTWLNSQPLEPIILKKPASMIAPEQAATVEETVIDSSDVLSTPAEEAETLEAVDTPITVNDLTTETEGDLTQVDSAAEEPKSSTFNERIQSLADTPRERTAPTRSVDDEILPVVLSSMKISEATIQTDNVTINKIIDVADQYADIPQLLLEVRGIAPMSATSAERELAYKNAQLIMSGLVSAGVPQHRMAAFVMLMDAAPGAVHIIRTR